MEYQYFCHNLFISILSINITKITNLNYFYPLGRFLLFSLIIITIVR